MTDTDLLATPGVDSKTQPSGGRESDSGQISKMSEHTDVARSGLTGMLLPQLRALAGELGIRGTSGMRKGDLIAAIKENQAGGSAPAEKPARAARTAKAAAKAPAEAPAARVEQPAPETAPADRKPAEQAEKAATEGKAAENTATEGKETAPKQSRGREAHADAGAKGDGMPDGAPAKQQGDTAEETGRESGQRGRGRQRRGRDQSRSAEAQSRNEAQSRTAEASQGDTRVDEAKQDTEQGERRRDRTQTGQPEQRNGRDGRDGRDDEEGGRGRRGRRFRERRRGRDRDGGEARELEIREDDVLQPVAGILDVLDNYAFVRTSGYLAGPNDVYVSMNLVRKNGLRRGDAITGAVRAPRDGEQSNQRQKFDPLVRLDTVNGSDVDSAKRRPDFNKLTPLYPNQRLRLETQQNKLTTRVIDLIMPIGKGQRALIVSPPKAGKTTIMQDIANAIAINNPECYLMVVLVDERPEEVTDMQRSVKGEVIASTFDRPPSDHTSVAELAIERAKRLVEMGKDVVVLLDSITRLGRAYNNSSPASGRILSGGVDSTALYPPKRFLGAARNIENGGSLTIIATAMVETGSTGDTVIFEEFKGTGNAELKLDRKIAERRVFPAVDVNPSGTRKDELLLSPDEAAVLHKLRRVLSGLDSHQAIDLLIDRLKKSKNNLEFLVQVSKNAPGAIDE
ncbi:transcription termination factor Rho [Nocardia donostiensis]|uniref:Transcription termination factor Rho n=1 Tax=Nocardia donostiensis TaxID=1538463 RepID=A0A1V2TBY0_9NOCA|nr:transcription termination factor Rho [Nocardia donostiensis]ONM46968.1 transcription termination factor Rho [Nocardia donostiensis]OQS14664.1 transcription termination factor Rho [Nocardia donostiensis]OQS18015.1 transcription termination factor Rho [Nocardia donostiensis]